MRRANLLGRRTPRVTDQRCPADELMITDAP
jgi:hypothetical protein